MSDENHGSSGGGILYWSNIDPAMLDLDALDVLPDDTRKCCQLAFLHATLAVSCVLGSLSSTKSNTNRGDAFFERAKSLMGNPLDATRCSLLDLSLLAMMALYLIEVDRTDTAYMYVSLGIHIAIMHGAHQGCVQDEHEKRSFWTLYLLDRWLCVSLGRPLTLLDESIHLALPADVRYVIKGCELEIIAQMLIVFVVVYPNHRAW